MKLVFWNVNRLRAAWKKGLLDFMAAERAQIFCSPTLDTEGRIVHTEFPDFHFFNVYFPNSGMGPERLAHKLRFYEAFLTLAERLPRRSKGVVICGDVNTAHTEIDLARPKESWRIDYFFVSDELEDRVMGGGILPHVQGSDHCPITLELE